MIISRKTLHDNMQASRSLRPAHILLLYRAGDAFGQQVAGYYAQARGVPTANIVPVTTTWAPANSLGTTEAQDNEILTAVCDALEANHDIKCLLLCGNWPTRMSLTKSQNNYYGVGISLNAGQYLSIPTMLRHPFAFRDDGFAFDYTTLISNTPIVWPTDTPYALNAEYLPEYGTQQGSDKLRLGNIQAFCAERQNSTAYEVGAYLWSSRTVSILSFCCVCTVAGTTDTTDQFPVSGAAGTSFTDGTATFEIVAAVDAPNAVTFNPTATFRLPDNHWDLLEADGDKPYGKNGATIPWRHFLSYSVMYLDAPTIGTGDPYNSSELAIVQRIVEGAIAIEAEKNTKLFGKVFLDGSSVYPSASLVYMELMDYGQDMTDVYYQNIDSEQTFYSYEAPYTLPADKLASGCTYGFPANGYDWVVQSDVFILAQSVGQYGTSGHVVHPTQTRAHYTFKGGIVVSGHSCGASYPIYMSIDSQHGTRALLAADNSGNINAKYTTRAALKYRNDDNISLTMLNLEYNGAATTAHVTVPSDNNVFLYEDGLPVALISLPTGTVQDHQDAIEAALPANWIVSPHSCSGGNCRAAQALRNGALVAAGSPIEPYSGSAANSTNLINVLAQGGCIGEWVLSNVTWYNRANEDSSIDLWTRASIQMVVYGDPLYRPFPLGFAK